MEFAKTEIFQLFFTEMSLKCFILFLPFLPLYAQTLLKDISPGFSNKPERLKPHLNTKINKLELMDHVCFLLPSMQAPAHFRQWKFSSSILLQ